MESDEQYIWLWYSQSNFGNIVTKYWLSYEKWFIASSGGEIYPIRHTYHLPSTPTAIPFMVSPAVLVPFFHYKDNNCHWTKLGAQFLCWFGFSFFFSMVSWRRVCKSSQKNNKHETPPQLPPLQQKQCVFTRFSFLQIVGIDASIIALCNQLLLCPCDITRKEMLNKL